jgi:hypothetical protein
MTWSVIKKKSKKGGVFCVCVYFFYHGVPFFARLFNVSSANHPLLRIIEGVKDPPPSTSPPPPKKKCPHPPLFFQPSPPPPFFLVCLHILNPSYTKKKLN